MWQLFVSCSVVVRRPFGIFALEFSELDRASERESANQRSEAAEKKKEEANEVQTETPNEANANETKRS